MKKSAKADEKTILIVEDDNILSDLLASALKGKGRRIVVLHDGIEAIGRIPYLKPDLILLDLMLPGPSGIDILKQLQTEGFSKIPVIIVTAAYRGSRLGRLGESFPNVVELFEKPVQTEKVRAAVLSHLEGR